MDQSGSLEPSRQLLDPRLPDLLPLAIDSCDDIENGEKRHGEIFGIVRGRKPGDAVLLLLLLLLL